jgi:hypothetical protein
MRGCDAPVFAKLYLENDADDVLAEQEDRRRAANWPGGPVRASSPGSPLAIGISRTGR